jgi:hypothetical protein
MPRIADPAVMHHLFDLARQANSARWFGPVQYLCLPDGLQAAWYNISVRISPRQTAAIPIG